MPSVLNTVFHNYQITCNVGQLMTSYTNSWTVWPSDWSYQVQSARSTPSRLTRLSSGALWGGEWMGMGCWYSGLPHCSGSTHHSSLKQLMIPYQLLQQQAGRHGASTTLQHVDSVGIGMLWACWLWHTDFLSHRVAYTQAICRLFVHVGLD